MSNGASPTTTGRAPSLAPVASEGSALRLGPLLCWAVVFADVGSSVYYVPGLLGGRAAVGGTAAVFVLLVSVVGIVLALKYADIAARYPLGGGVVTVATDAFGPFVGCLGGVLITTDYFLTSSIGAMAGVRYLGSVVSLHGAALPLACGALLLLGTLNVVGLRASALVSLAMGALGFVTQLVLVAVTASQLSPADWAGMRLALARVEGLSAGSVLMGFGTAWLAFSGLESLSQIGGALRPPRRRVARLAVALVFGSVLATSPLLTAFSTTILAQHAPAVPRADRLISELAGVFGGVSLKLAVVLSATALLVLSANTAILGGYHVFLALTRQGFLPAALAARNRRFGTPHVAIAVATVAPVSILLATGGEVRLLGELYAFGLLGAFTLSSAGLDRVRWRERRRGPAFVAGLVTTGLVALAFVVNLFAKPLATVFGGASTLAGMLLALAVYEGWWDALAARFILDAALLRAGRALRELVAFYDRHLSLDQRDLARVHRALGRIRRDRGDARRAIAAYGAAAALDPGDVDARLQLARLHQRLGEHALAVRALVTVVELQPARAESHFRLGLALLKQGGLDEAVGPLQRAVELDPGHARAFHRLGLLLSRKQRFDDAVAALARAIALEPHQPRYHRHLGFVYETMGRRAEAAACFTAELELERRRESR